MADPLLTRRILWFALLASQAIYFWILAFSGAVPPVVEPPDPMLPMVLAGAAALVGVLSFALPMLLLRSIRAAPADPHAPRPSGHAATFVPFILSLSLSEAVALFGLVVGFLGHRVMVWAPFLVAGFLLTAWRFPTESRMNGALTRSNGVTVG